MSWELSEEHEMFRKVVRDFAEAEIAPHAAQWDRDHYFPVDVVQAMGDLGLFGLVFPERVGRQRRRLRLAVRRDRRARPSRSVDGHHAVGRRRPRRQPDLPVRHRGAEGPLAARPRRRSSARRVRADRSRRRQRRRRDPHQGAAPRRRMGDRRQRRRSSRTRARRSPRSSRSRPAPTRASRRSSCRPARPGSSSSRRTASSAGTPAIRTA